MISRKGQKNICNCPKLTANVTSNNVTTCASAPQSALVHVENSQPKKGTSQQGLREGWTRVTFILKEDHVEKLKSLAYWERSTIKEIVDDALSMYLENAKKKIIEREL